MPLIKPANNWKDETGNRYDGPPPDPGTYTGKIVRMGLSAVKRGDNEGADMWVISAEITEGKFAGASILVNFPMLKQTAFNFNTFLKAMTDGSDKQKSMILDWYYERGYSLEAEEKYKGLGRQVEFIGKPAFKPIGKKVKFTVVRNGEYTNIDRFLVPLEDSGEDGEPEALEQTEETTVAEEEETLTATEETTAEPEDADDDDPWS